MTTDLLSLAGTLAAYAVARWICQRSRHWLANPFLIGAALVITGLALAGLPYAEYRRGAAPLAFLLGPATVALGVPLYKNLPLLRRNLSAVVLAGGAGATVGVAAMVAAGVAIGFGRVLMLSLIPKSVTTPVAVAITELLGGDGNLTAAMTTVTGFTGVLFLRPLLDRIGVKSPIARGLALGVSIHGVGTVAALEEGELPAAMAGLGMTIAAVCTALLAPAAAWLVSA